MVIVNEDTTGKDVTIDLTRFSETAKSAAMYRTSQNEDCVEIAGGLPVWNKKSTYMAPAKSVTTLQLEVTGN